MLIILANRYTLEIANSVINESVGYVEHSIALHKSVISFAVLY